MKLGNDFSFPASNRIRRRPLWTPNQLGSDLALWLDAKDSDFDLRTNNGTDYVERWGDLSGNNNDNSQSSGSQQPQKDDNQVLFDGNDDFLRFDTEISTDTHTYFAVVSGQPINVGRPFPFGNSQTGADLLSSDKTKMRYREGGDNYEISVNADDTRLVSWRRNSDSSVRIGSDGGYNNIRGARGPTDGVEVDNLGRRSDSFFAENKMGMRTAISVSVSLSDEIVFKIEGWAAHKWSLTDKLPSTHPYHDEPPTV